MRTVLVLTAMLTAGLVAGCSSGDDATPVAAPQQAAAEHTTTTMTTPVTPPDKFADQWTAKFNEVMSDSGDASCADPGTAKCAAAIADIEAWAQDLQAAIGDRPDASRFMQSSVTAEEIIEAAKTYESLGCATQSTDECGAAVVTVMVKPVSLTAQLTADALS